MASVVCNTFCLHFSSLLCFASHCIKEVLYLESALVAQGGVVLLMVILCVPQGEERFG